MKVRNSVSFLLIVCFCICFTACQRSSSDFWEDSKSAHRHMTRGVRTLGGKSGDSRAIRSRDQFMPSDGFCREESYDCPPASPPAFCSQPIEEFIPLCDQPADDTLAMATYVSQQPRESPGEPGSSIPGIEYFQDPSRSPRLAPIFRHVYFEYNSNLIKGSDNIATLRNIAAYLRQNPNTYIFVEGHCDQRGPEAYNLALGAHRSNSVRNFLLQEGVNPDNVFTISYGKERPLINENNEEAWSQNRRAEFKVYQR